MITTLSVIEVGIFISIIINSITDFFIASVSSSMESFSFRYVMSSGLIGENPRIRFAPCRT